LFSGLEKKAKQASEMATHELAQSLTGLFHQHLRSSGIPPQEARGCKIIHDPEQNTFIADLTPHVQELDWGTETRPPMGLTTRFFNRIDVPKMHRTALLKATKKVGLT
jgi:hypothetical protein